MPDHPHEAALQWHVDLAEAVAAGDATAAKEASQRIMRRTMTRMSGTWTDQPRVFIPVRRPT
jgi:DNA-binding FadR family transcriptional regulator